MIWLTGSKGMLGAELSHVLESKGIPFIGSGREADITSVETFKQSACRGFFTNQDLKLIINCAAYSNVDKAEDDRDTAYALNTIGAENIAKYAASIGAKLIHFSTDYVFNGRGTRPYTEEDETDPLGVYGRTKRDGEAAVLQANPSSWIIRTAWLYGRQGKNFVETMLRLMNEKDEVKVVNDQRGSPTRAHDLVQVIVLFIEKLSAGKDIPYGIYHYTDEGETTWFDFAAEIYKEAALTGILKRQCELKPCSSAEYPSKAIRPAYSVLDKTKIKKELHITIPHWKESLRGYLASRTAENV
jgi:dTDP-4-dehydrorhamnose reductase